jgi:hypothetical protein
VNKNIEQTVSNTHWLAVDAIDHQHNAQTID